MATYPMRHFPLPSLQIDQYMNSAISIAQASCQVHILDGFTEITCSGYFITPECFVTALQSFKKHDQSGYQIPNKVWATMGAHVEGVGVNERDRKHVIKVVIPDEELEGHRACIWDFKADFCFCFVAPESKSEFVLPLPGEVEWTEGQAVCAFGRLKNCSKKTFSRCLGYPTQPHHNEIMRCFRPTARDWISQHFQEEKYQQEFTDVKATEVEDRGTGREADQGTDQGTTYRGNDLETDKDHKPPRSVSQGRKRSQSMLEGRTKRHKHQELERKVMRAHSLTFGGYHQLVTSVGVFAPSFPGLLALSAAVDAQVSASPGMPGGAVCVLTHGQLRPVGLVLGACFGDSNRVFVFAGSPAFWSAFCVLIPDSDSSREFLAFAKHKLQTDVILQRLPYFSGGYVPGLIPLGQKIGGPLMQLIRAAPRTSK